MLDQSFSAKNFYDILLRENRKGLNLEKEFFEVEVFEKYSIRIKNLNDKLRKGFNKFIQENPEKRHISFQVYRRYKRRLRYQKKILKELKEEKIMDLLIDVGKKVQKKSFKFELEIGEARRKVIYKIKNRKEEFFAMKQLQVNFRKLFGVKQANRFEIVNHVKHILNDKFPKYIIKTDLKNFYESIPTTTTLEQLNADNLLSPKSKKLIKQTILSYQKLSGKEKGIPRGLGISAYIAEYYARKIDDIIKNLEDVTYYSRYVDDIIIIFTPKNITNNPPPYFETVREVFENDFQLNLNMSKTEKINLIQSEGTINVNDNNLPSPQKLDYLGYSYQIENNLKKVKINDLEIYLTESKIKKYKSKIKLSFENYKKYKDLNKGYRQLKNRLKFLTGNTRLVNNKSNVLVGIYFSNMMLTNTESLEQLDRYLKWYIKRFVKKQPHIDKLLGLSFVEGFENRIFYRFSTNQLLRIVRPWKNL